MGLDLRGMLSQRDWSPIASPESRRTFSSHVLDRIAPLEPPTSRTRDPVRLLEFLFIGTLFWLRDAVQLISIFLNTCLSHLLNYFYFFFLRIDPQFAQKWGTDAQLQTWFWRGDGISLNGKPLQRPEGHPARIHSRITATLTPMKYSPAKKLTGGTQLALSEPKDLWNHALDVSDLDLKQCPTSSSSLSSPSLEHMTTSTKLKGPLCAFSDTPNAEQLQQLRGILSYCQYPQENRSARFSAKKGRLEKSKATTRTAWSLTARSPTAQSTRIHQRKLFFKWRRVKRQKSRNNHGSAASALLHSGTNDVVKAGFPEVNFSEARAPEIRSFSGASSFQAEFPDANCFEHNYSASDLFGTAFPPAVGEIKNVDGAAEENLQTLSLSDAAPGCTPAGPVMEPSLPQLTDFSAICTDEIKPSKRDRFKKAFQRRSRPTTTESTMDVC